MKLRLQYSWKPESRKPADDSPGGVAMGPLYEVAAEVHSGKMLYRRKMVRPRHPGMTSVSFAPMPHPEGEVSIIVGSPRSMKHAMRIARQNRMIQKVRAAAMFADRKTMDAVQGHWRKMEERERVALN